MAWHNRCRSFIELTPIAPGSTCPAGGTEVTVGLSDVESQVADICNGTSVVQGEDGGELAAAFDAADGAASQEADAGGEAEASEAAASGAITLSSTSLSFEAPCGSTPPAQAFNITNTGGAPVTWAATLEGSGFSIDPSGSTLAPGAAVAVTVTPAPIPTYPLGGPTFAGEIVITTDIPAGSAYDVALSGLATGYYLGSPATNIDFGDVAVGSTSTITVSDSLLAIGTAESAFILVVPTVGPFTTPSLEGSPPGEWPVTFAPTTLGIQSATLTWGVEGSGEFCTPNSFTATGTGIAVGQ